MNKEQYIQVLHGLLKVVCWRQLDMWTASVLMLLHDSTSTHYSILDRQELVKCGNVLLPYPPSSPNIAMCNLFLFDWLKPMLCGHISTGNSQCCCDAHSSLAHGGWNPALLLQFLCTMT